MLRDGFLRFCDNPEIACCKAERELEQLRAENASLRAQPTNEPLTRDYVEEAPAADVAQVVRGEWCYTTYDSAGDELHQCSHCNKFSHEKSCYCPNCGAKMDKEG